jgi:beta-glucosidase
MSIRAIAAPLAALALFVAPQLPAAEATPLYKDATRPIPERVDDLLRRMTLEEKVAQMITVWNSKPSVMDAQLQIDPAKMRTQYPNGLGQFARPSDARGPASPRVEKGRDPRQTVELVNAVQRYAVTQTRLGIPVLFHEEGLHGYAALGATSFPQAIALASSWDTALVREVNAITAREIRARGVHLALTPVVDCT